MAELSTIARPYARATFQSASSAGLLSEWSQSLARAAAVVSDARVASLIGNPRVPSAGLVDLVSGIATTTGVSGQAQPGVQASDARMSAALRNLLMLLAHNRRLALLPQIASQFEVLRADAENVASVEVLSARELTPQQSQQLQASLQRRLGRAVRLHQGVDPRLLGGALVRYGDLVIDGSLRGRIERMGAALSGS